MSGVVVTDIQRADQALVARAEEHGVATVHEAMGRTGLAGHGLRPIQDGARVAGTAVTVLCWPGDNLMIHAAVEQCRPGDFLVVTTNSPSVDGAFGELFATALSRRGVRGLITTTGVRDVAELREMGFPVWSAAVNAQGTVKATGGSVNVPIVVGEALVKPGDIIVADDDGVLCVPRERAAEALAASDARIAKEEIARQVYREGGLSLDHNDLRGLLSDLGVRYVSQSEYERDRD